MFHRLTSAPYFFTGGGTVPSSGYDRLNTPSDATVGGAGVPAVVDPIKAGGVNDGTYFVAFSEKGRSGAVNRGMYALAENTDELDNVVMRSIPKRVEVTATSGAPVSSYAAAGWVYVGVFGTANTADNRDRLIRVLDSAGNELEVSGSKVRCSLLHDGTSVNVVGTAAEGFYDSPTFDFSPSIPAGTYTIVYGTRTNYKEMSSTYLGALFEAPLLYGHQVNYEVRKLLRLLHAETSVGQLWNDAFDSTIRSLASSGLNERYRRSTTQPAGFTTADFNVAGGGSLIIRDGRAVELQQQDVSYGSTAPDGMFAALRVSDPPAVFSSLTASLHPSVGLYRNRNHTNTGDTNEKMQGRHHMGPLVLEAIARDVRASTLAGNATFTRITPTAAATANPDAGTSNNARATIELAAGDFHTASGKSALRDMDLLEVVNVATGDSYGMFRVPVDAATRPTNTRVRVVRLEISGTSSTAVFPSGVTTAVYVYWHQVTVALGGNGGGQTAYGMHPFLVTTPSPLTGDGAERRGDTAVFLAGGNFGATSTDAGPPTLGSTLDSYTRAFGWGGWTSSGAMDIVGRLFDDGSIEGANFFGRHGVFKYPRINSSTPNIFKRPYAIHVQQDETGSGTGWPNSRYGGVAGLFQTVEQLSVGDSNEAALEFTTGPLVAEATKRDIRASTLNGGAVWTRLSTNSQGSLNPDSGSSATDKATIEVGVNDYFQSGGSTRFRTCDLLEVWNTVGTFLGTFRVAALVPGQPRRAYLTPVDVATYADFGTSIQFVTYRWLQPTMWLGGVVRNGAQFFHGDTPPMQHPHFFTVLNEGYLTAVPNSEVPRYPPLFLSSRVDSSSSSTLTVQQGRAAFAWGGFGTAVDAGGLLQYAVNGYLEGDGGIRCLGGRQALRVVNRPQTTQSVAATVTVSIDPRTEPFKLVRTGAGATVRTITIETAAGFDSEAVAGDEFLVLIELENGASNCTVAFESNTFFFATGDSTIPTSNATGSSLYYFFSFRLVKDTAIGAPRWFAQRKTYP